MPLDTKHFKEKLERELAEVVAELKTVGRVNPANPADWEARPPDFDILASDQNEAADRIEGYEENSAILKELETRFNNIKTALQKIEKGTFGVCEVAGEEIELDRLEANPAARTCKKHLDAAE